MRWFAVPSVFVVEAGWLSVTAISWYSREQTTRNKEYQQRINGLQGLCYQLRREKKRRKKQRSERKSETHVVVCQYIYNIRDDTMCMFVGDSMVSMRM